MSPDELKALGEDIKQNGLRNPCCIAEDEDSRVTLFDGRNRLDALELLGDDQRFNFNNHIVFERFEADYIDIPERVVSLNIHRRHLTGEQKRGIIAELIKSQPEKPDLQIAKTVKVSPTTVGTVRREMEAKGDVSKLETRTDRRGRGQPARKPRKPTRPPAAQPPAQAIRDAAAARPQAPVSGQSEPQAAAESPVRPVPSPPPPPSLPRDDIGRDSASEAERLRVRVEELQADKHRLESELHAARDKRIEQLIVERRKWVDAPLPSLNLARLPLGDQLIILIGLLENGLAPVRNLVAALELPANASVKRRAQLDGIDDMVGAVFNWMSTTRDYVAEIKQALDDYASTTASTAPPTTTPPDIQPPADDGLGIPEFLDRTKQTEITS
jgi:hypothetical protein